MVIFDLKNNNFGQSQGTMHIQGMDVVFLLGYFGLKNLKNKIAPDFLDYFDEINKSIENEKSSDQKDIILRKSIQLGIEKTEIDTQFKKLIEELLKHEVLYDKQRLSSISKEELERNIALLNKQEIINSKLDARNQYELNSLKCALYIIEKMEKYNEIVCDMYSASSANKNVLYYKMRNIAEELKSMGLGIDDEEELTMIKRY